MLEYVKEIAIFLIFSQAVMSLIPKKRYNKYMRLFLGAILIVLIVRPINDFFYGTVEFDKILSDIEYGREISELEKNINGADEYLSGKAMESYEILIAGKIDEIVADKGYECKKCDVEFEENEGQYNIKRIAAELTVMPASKGEVIVDKVVINVFDDREIYDSDDMAEVKKLISEEYEIGTEYISVNIRSNR